MFWFESNIHNGKIYVQHLKHFPLYTNTVYRSNKFWGFFAIDEVNAGVSGSSTLQGSECAGGNGGAAKRESPPGISHTHHQGPPGPATEYPQGTV